MTMAETNNALEKVLLDPAAFFDSPTAVLDADHLTDSDKLLILHRWEIDARALEVATEEAMTGGETSRLGEVLKAIRDLGGRAKGSGTPTKA